MNQRSKRSSSSFRHSGSSGSSSTFTGVDDEKMLLRSSKNVPSRYDLNSEDGFDARNLDLKTFEDRWKAFRDHKISNVNPYEQCKFMYVERLQYNRWVFRVMWNIVMLGGFITNIYKLLVINFKWVITLIFSSLLLDFKDYINDWWDDVLPTDRRQYHWAATIIVLLLFAFVLKFLVIIEWIWETGMYTSSDSLKRRLRRSRFKYLHDEQVKIDPLCRDFTMIYNDDNDPDIAMSVYRRKTDELPPLLWLIQPNDLYLE